MIIGLTGRNASGKGSVAEFLKGNGFAYYSLSDILRDEVRQRGLPMTREVLIAVGIELRTVRGTSYLAERVLERLDKNQNCVIDSCRHEGEVNFLRKMVDYRLLAVQADPIVRFERVKLRARESDPQTFEAFLELDARDVVPSEFMADYTLINNGPLDELHMKISNIVTQWTNKQNLPI